MRITEAQLRRMIRRTLLSEQVFGAQAFVYHGSNLPPDEFLPLILEDKFIPGGGSGAMYGKGLYTVYNLAGTQTESGIYGNYIYKLKVNLHGCICFDSAITEKIYGKKLSPADQARLLRLPRDLARKLEAVADDDPYTSGEALKASKFLSGRVKGIVFTGRNDGQVAVIYDATAVTPVAWKMSRDVSGAQYPTSSFSLRMQAAADKISGKKPTSSGWQNVEPELVRKQIKKNLEQGWQEEKYEITRKMKPGSVVRGNHYLEDGSLLSPNVRFEGDLIVESLSLETFPTGIQVGGKLTIMYYASSELPAGLSAARGLDIDFCPKLARLPEDLSVGGDLVLESCPALEELPRGLSIEGDLILKECSSLRELPQGLKVGGRLLLGQSCPVPEIPADAQISGRGAIEQHEPFIQPPRLWTQYINATKERNPEEYERIVSGYRESKRGRPPAYGHY